MKDKRILVTGADGFIGSHLTELLVQEGAHVKALCLYNSFNTWGWLDESPCLADIEVVAGDVRDAHFCLAATRNVDLVFHLAALIAIPYSYTAPGSYVDTNVKGSLNICQAVLANGCERIIHASTSETYGTARYAPMDENHPLQPQSPYSASKIGADMTVMSFYHAFNLPAVIARPFNTYGPRQSARAVIPAIIIQLLAGADTVRLGDARPTRDFTYVEDTCRGLAALAACDAAVGQTVNIGSGREIAIGDLARLIIEIMHCDVRVEHDPRRLRPAASEVDRLCCDNAKLKRLTGFVPETALREGLERTIAWFRNPRQLSKYKADIYNQ